MKAKTIFKSAVLIIGVVIIPLLYSYFYLGAFWDPYNNLKTVPVAIVNDDKGAKINDTERNLGDEAAQKLIDDDTLKFIKTTGTDASNGVRGTKYYAVITFPSDFSSDIASATTTDKMKATIHYEANKKRNYIASQLMKTVIAEVEEQVRGSVAKDIVSQLSAKLEDVPNQLSDLSSGLITISDGADSLSDGAEKAANGQTTMTDGINTLSSGLFTLSTGSKTLSGGINNLSVGIDKTADGVSTLSNRLSTNLPILTGGIAQLNNGAKLLFAQFAPATTSQPTVYDGITQLTGGTKALLAQMSKGGGTTLYDKVTSLSTGASTYVSAVDNTLYAMITANKTASAQLLTAYEQNLAQLKAAYGAATDDATKQQHYQQLQFTANLVTMYSAALNPSVTTEAQFEAALNQAAADPTKATLVSNGAALSGGATLLQAQFGDGGTLKSYVTQLNAGTQQLASQFADGGAFKTGMQGLAQGAQQLQDSASSLTQLQDGVTQVNQALAQLQGGAKQLQSGAAKLSNGIDSAKNGAAKLSSGSKALQSANAELADGAKQLADGAATAKNEVSDSIITAKNDTQSLTGLDNYTEKSVTVKEDALNDIPNYGTAFAPYFMSLSLWVGALLIFFGIYFDANSRIRVLSRDTDKKILRVLGFAGIGVAQAVVLAVVVQFVLGLAIDNIPAFYLSCILISLVFLSIIEFLIVNLRDLGKFLSIALLVLNLTSCGGTFPMETVPKFFNTIYPYMPMTYSVNLLKEVTSSFNVSTAWQNAGVLIAIFVVFTVLTVLFSLTRHVKSKVERRPVVQLEG